MSKETANAFDELFAQLTPNRFFQHPQATGEGVKVCVIDSGMEQGVLEARCRERDQELLPIEGGIFSAGQNEPTPYEGHQSTPHGTTVADIILTLAPKVQLYSADVFGPQGSTEVEVVLRALHWAVHVWKCKIINLSLGVTEQRLQPIQRRNQLIRAIEDSYFQDVIIVAAAHNDHPLTRSFPAVLSPSLISVDKSDFEKPLDFAYSLREKIEFQAYSRGYHGPFAQEPATSWAAPHLTGIIARLLSLRPTLKPFEIKSLLYWLSLANN